MIRNCRVDSAYSVDIFYDICYHTETEYSTDLTEFEKLQITFTAIHSVTYCDAGSSVIRGNSHITVI